MERTFNLIDEPWICVRTQAQTVREVGLRELFLEAHTFTDLAGETKTQDLAMLRLLLAIVHTVFSRYGIDGEAIDPSEDPDLLVDQWEDIWNSGQFPATPIEHYLDQWHDRFWLFDEDFPFYQSKAVDGKSKPISTAKMIGTLFESNHKKRLFSARTGEGRDLSYAEAARWLLHLICFDDIAAKHPTPKKPWVGQLGAIMLKGETLFQTLMLNYVADQDGRNNVYTSAPSWETDTRSVPFNRLIPVPADQAALLSLLSRRVLLCREDDRVTGYYLSGGDYFEEEAPFDREMMTLWRGFQEKKDSPYQFRPRRYTAGKMIWREFGSIAVEKETNTASAKQAGVIGWRERLIGYEILSADTLVQVETTAVVYDYKQATCLPVIDAISDGLTFHAKLLEEIGEGWRIRVLDEIDRCERAAKQVYLLYKNLQNASGRRDKDGKTELSGERDATSEFYARIDRPFRLWLAALDPSAGDCETACAALETQLRTIALRYGNELAAQADSSTIFGRYEKDKLVSSASALNMYRYQISKKIFTREVKHDEQG